MESSAQPAPTEVRSHYAVYRKDYQLFEILRPVYSKKDPAVIQKFGYDDTLAVSSWIVCKSAPETAHEDKEVILIKGKPVEYVYTGAELRPAPGQAAAPGPAQTEAAAAHPPIPIVRFLRSNHLPNTIKGIRIAYMDDIGSDYFTKKTPAGSKALHLVFRGEKAVVMNKEELVKEQEEKEHKAVHEPENVQVPEAEDDDFCDQFKNISFLSILCLFFLFAYYKNESRKYPYIPFKDVCHPDDAPFFMDPFSISHP